MGQEVARDEVIQAEPSWEAVGWGLHARVKAGGLLFGVSSAGKEEGRGSPAGSRLPLSSGFNLGVVGGRGSGQLGGSSETQETGRCGHPPFRLPVQTPRGTMGCLLGLGQELWVGEGEGEAGQGGGGRLAGSTPPAAGPSGALTAQRGPLLQREGRGNWGSLAEEGPGTRTLFQFPLPPPGPVSICLPAGTSG